MGGFGILQRGYALAVFFLSVLFLVPVWAEPPPSSGEFSTTEHTEYTDRAVPQTGAAAGEGTQSTPDNVDRDAPDFVTASLLVMGPGDELYSCAGHAALRMECPTYGLDYCFSYESESISERVPAYFAGRLKMGMFAIPTKEFLKTYSETGRGVMQYKLDLPPKVETQLWRLLDEKVAEGADLPYDFIKRGCAQAVLSALRDAVALERIVPGPWPEKYAMTRREFINSLIGETYPWNLLVLNSICGTEVDWNVPNLERVIIPEDLLEFLREARIAGRPVVTDEGEELLPAKSPEPPPFVTPMRVSFVLAALAVLGCFVRLPWLVWVFLPFQTLAGLFLAYLVFFSNLPATSWNWLIVPFNPLPAICWKWRRRWALGFAVVLAVWVTFMAFAPHRMTDPAYLVLVTAYAVFYLFLSKQS